MLSAEAHGVVNGQNPRSTRSLRNRRQSTRFGLATSENYSEVPNGSSDFSPSSLLSPNDPSTTEQHASSTACHPHPPTPCSDNISTTTLTPQVALPSSSLSQVLSTATAPRKRQGKRGGKRTKNADISQVEEPLQGIAPILPQASVSDDDNAQPQPAYGSILHREQGPRKGVGSPYYLYTYPIYTDPPEKGHYSGASEPPSEQKPRARLLGCRMCNKPSENGVEPTSLVTYNNLSATTNIKRHLGAYHPDLVVDPPKPQSRGLTESPSPFNLQQFVDNMITWMITSDQALRLVDSEAFRQMLRSLNQSLSDQDIPHRTKIRTEVLKRYKEGREELRLKLKESLGRISLTSDLWSDSNMTSFMAVTLHWIARTHEGEIELKTALGGFRWVKDKHSGENIADRFVEILEELDILDHIGGITMDNAQNNNTAMDGFEAHLEARSINFVSSQQRIRCFAHVINLAVQDGLAALPHPDSVDLREERDPVLREKCREGRRDKGYADALETDLMGCSLELIAKLRASGQRREALRQAIVDGNQNQLFPAQIPPLQLLRAVVTRWSSYFYMLDRFIHLSPAINLLLDRPNPASLTRDDTFTVKEMSVLIDIRRLLAFFNEAQETLACEKTPTLSFVLPLYEELLGALKELCFQLPKLMHAINASIKKLEKYQAECMGSSSLYTLAMVLHPGVKLNWLENVTEYAISQALTSPQPQDS